MRTANTLVRLGGCQGWSESSLGTQFIFLVLSCSNDNTVQHSSFVKIVGFFMPLSMYGMQFWLDLPWNASVSLLHDVSVLVSSSRDWELAPTIVFKSCTVSIYQEPFILDMPLTLTSSLESSLWNKNMNERLAKESIIKHSALKVCLFHHWKQNILKPSSSYHFELLWDFMAAFRIKYLSYVVTVIQWLTSCHKNSMPTRYMTLGYWHVTSWCLLQQCYVFYWNNVNFSGDKIPFKNRISHLWPFHMKFMKLAEGSFHKFCMCKIFYTYQTVKNTS